MTRSHLDLQRGVCRAEKVAQAVWSITEQPRGSGILRVEIEPADILAVKFYQALTKHTENVLLKVL